MAFLEDFLKSFALLFFIMNPLASLPLFLKITGKLKSKEVAHNASNAILVAGSLLFVFLLFGNAVLDLFGVSFASFQVAGGIVLLLMGLELVLGLKFLNQGAKKVDAAIVIVGTPLLTGPGVITTVIILHSEVGLAVAAAAGIASLALSWLFLRFGSQLEKRVGEAAIESGSKVMGLLLAATAVELIRKGLVGA